MACLRYLGFIINKARLLYYYASALASMKTLWLLDWKIIEGTERFKLNTTVIFHFLLRIQFKQKPLFVFSLIQKILLCWFHKWLLVILCHRCQTKLLLQSSVASSISIWNFFITTPAIWCWRIPSGALYYRSSAGSSSTIFNFKFKYRQFVHLIFKTLRVSW